jgi:hypothetical protein
VAGGRSPAAEAHFVRWPALGGSLRYRPLGSFDYQRLPTGPAVHVICAATDEARLEALVASARAAGYRIHDAGPVATKGSRPDESHAFIVLEVGTEEHELLRFADWIERQPGLTLAAVPRTGTESYED